MLLKWRRIRLLFIIVSAFIGAGLLILAYALIGSVPGVTIVTLAFLAIVLPVGMYLIATVVGWQNSAGSGAEPNAIIGWLIKTKLVPFLPIFFMFFLFGIGMGLDLSPNDGGSASAAARGDGQMPRAFHDSCVAGANKELRKSGGDPDKAELKLKVVAYCDCVAAEIPREYKPDEFIKIAADPSRLDKEEKMNRIVDRCGAKVFQ